MDLHEAQLLIIPQSATSATLSTLENFFLGEELRPVGNESMGVIAPLSSFSDEELRAYVPPEDCVGFKAALRKSNADTLEQMEYLLSKFVKESLSAFPSALPNIQKMTTRLQRPEDESHQKTCALCLCHIPPYIHKSFVTQLCPSCTIAARDARIGDVDATINWINEQAEDQVAKQSIKVARSG